VPAGLLWLVTAQVNHYLSVWRVYLFIGGLFVTYRRPAALAPVRAGRHQSSPACSATPATPVPFGTHLLLFAAAHAVIYNLRDRVPRDQTGTRVIIALLANLGLFLVFSFFLIGRSPAPAEVWPRLIFDLACSQVFLALVAPWFFALQTRALELAGLENRSLF
jgi:hypothetical protein